MPSRAESTIKILAAAGLSLLLLGACPGARAGAYDDLLVFAANNETEKVVELLGKGLDVNTTDREGNTLAMIAARGGNRELLAFLVKNRASLVRRNSHGDDALMLAAYNGDLESVKLLVQAGAPLDHDGWTALHYAAFQGHAGVAAYLLDRGADKDALAANRQSALMLAARNGHEDVARLLKARGADLGLKDPAGKTARDLALEHGNTDMAAWLQP